MEKLRYAVLVVLVFLASTAAFAQESSPDEPLLIPVPHPQTHKWGYIDRTGKVVIDFQFDQADYFSEGLAGVELHDRCGYIDRSAKLVISYRRCYFLHSFKHGFAVFEKSRRSKLQYIDKNGKYLANLKFGYIDGFSEGLAHFITDLQAHCCWGFIDTTGRVVIPPKYEDYSYNFYEGLAAVRLKGKAGFIDRSDNESEFEEAMEFSEGLAAAKVNGKWGFIDRTGTFVIPPQFSYVRTFAEGYAVAYVADHQAGIIDHNGRWLLEPKYSYVTPFEDGYAEAGPGTMGLVDRTGKFVVPPTYGECGYVGEGLYSVLFYENNVAVHEIRELNGGKVIYRYTTK